MKIVGLIVLAIIAIIAAFAFMPLLFLWCVKAIAPGLGVEYTWTTWFASLLLILLFLGGSSSTSKK